MRYIIIRLKGNIGLSPTLREFFQSNRLRAPNHFVVRRLSHEELVSFTNIILPAGFIIEATESLLGVEVLNYIDTLQENHPYSFNWPSRSRLVLTGTALEISTNIRNGAFFIEAYRRNNGQ